MDQVYCKIYMVNLTLPAGAKDLLPLDVAQQLWIENRLQQVFQAWGYHRIITPTLEHLETLTAGGAVKAEAVIQMHGSETLGLRPELTASIARSYAPRLDKVITPQRLYYNANVFRKVAVSGYPGQQEYHQAGVELLGAAGLGADGEILLLLSDCLKHLELPNWQMVLGDAALTSSLLTTFPSRYRPKIRKCLAELDRVGLLNLPIPQDLRSQALELMDLRGKPQDVLAKIAKLDWIGNLETEISHLQSLVKLLVSTNLLSATILDLSLIQTFDYYTGIVFEVVCDNHVVAQGGRYDQLLGLYHPQGVTYPSVGFCLNLEDLHKVLLPVLPKAIATTDWLVVPSSQEMLRAAFDYAGDLRNQGKSVEVDLGVYTPEESRANAIAYAKSRQIKQIAWISLENEPEILFVS
jgi:ATP phosphoribosyltransferase regulatory subunit